MLDLHSGWVALNMTTIADIHSAFELLFKALCDKSFTKTLNLEHWGERDLLPLVRVFLLGYFGECVIPEAQVKLPGASIDMGRVDFIVDGVAVEFAVRKPTDSHSTVGKANNTSEVKKLLKYNGKALLVLFDFSTSPLSSDDLEAYREIPPLGRGNHVTTPFQLSYFFKKNGELCCEKKRIKRS